MWDAIVSVLRVLVPPHDGDPAVYRWRVGVVLFMGAMTLGYAIHIGLACGYFATTIIGFPGFARADAVSDVREAVKVIQIDQFDSKLQEDLGKRCAAERSHNAMAEEELTRRIDWELDRYRALTSREYRQPSCSEILPQWTATGR